MSILKENAIGVIAYNQGHDNQKWHKADSDNTYRMYNTQVLKKINYNNNIPGGFVHSQ